MFSHSRECRLDHLTSCSRLSTDELAWECVARAEGLGVTLAREHCSKALLQYIEVVKKEALAWH